MLSIIVSTIISGAMIIGSLVHTGHSIDSVKELIERFGANSTISNLTEKTTLQSGDLIAIVDNQGTPTTKKITAGNATSSMKAYNDLQYSPIFSTSAGLFGLISDETGSAGGVVRATSPTLTTPTINAPTLDVAGTDATGDIYYNGGSGVMTRLAPGSNGEYLRLDSGLPDWDNTALLTNPQTSSSTFTATTSFSASNINSNALILNGLAYAMPSTRAASSTVLTEDGTGKLRWYLPQSSILYMSNGSSTVSSSATTTVLTVPIPANTLGSNGSLRITAYVCFAGAGGSQYKYEIAFGNGSASTTIAQMGANIGNNANNFQATVMNYTTGIQRSFARIEFANSIDAITTATDKVYRAQPNVDTTAKTYLAFRAGEGAASVENGYCGVLVELLKP